MELPPEARRRVAEDQVAWLTTVTDSGAPAPNPVWFVPSDDGLVVFTMPSSRKARNMERRPSVSLHFNSDRDGGDIVIINGTAALTPDRHLSRFPGYLDKYEAAITGPLASTVEGMADLAPTEADVKEVHYRLDETCNVVYEGVTRLDQGRFRRAQGLGDDSPPLVRSEAKTTGAGAGDMTAARHILYGNYVHTSQTVQDVFFIDIAKMQYHTDRIWDYTCTWWKPDRVGSASTSVRWNHPERAWIFEVLGTRCGGDWTRTGAAGSFRSDFLWCNFTASWQRLYLYNYNYSRSDGYAGAYWSQNVSCPGTHMATRIWQNIDRDG